MTSIICKGLDRRSDVTGVVDAESCGESKTGSLLPRLYRFSRKIIEENWKDSRRRPFFAQATAAAKDGCLDDAALPFDRNVYRGAEFGGSLFPSTNLTGIYVDCGCQLDGSLRNKTWKVYDLIMVLASV